MQVTAAADRLLLLSNTTSEPKPELERGHHTSTSSALKLGAQSRGAGGGGAYRSCACSARRRWRVQVCDAFVDVHGRPAATMTGGHGGRLSAQRVAHVLIVMSPCDRHQHPGAWVGDPLDNNSVTRCDCTATSPWLQHGAVQNSAKLCKACLIIHRNARTRTPGGGGLIRDRRASRARGGGWRLALLLCAPPSR